jgi:hypothetical protein
MKKFVVEHISKKKIVMDRIRTTEGLIKQAEDHLDRLKDLLRDLCNDWENAGNDDIKIIKKVDVA